MEYREKIYEALCPAQAGLLYTLGQTFLYQPGYKPRFEDFIRLIGITDRERLPRDLYKELVPLSENKESPFGFNRTGHFGPKALGNNRHTDLEHLSDCYINSWWFTDLTEDLRALSNRGFVCMFGPNMEHGKAWRDSKCIKRDAVIIPGASAYSLINLERVIQIDTEHLHNKDEMREKLLEYHKLGVTQD